MVEHFHAISDLVASADAAGLTGLQALAQREVGTAWSIDGDISKVAVIFIGASIADFIVGHAAVVGAVDIGDAVHVGDDVAVDVASGADLSNVALVAGGSVRANLETDRQPGGGSWGESKHAAEAAGGGAIAVVDPVAVSQRHACRYEVGDLDGLGGDGALIEDFNAVADEVAGIDGGGLI